MHSCDRIIFFIQIFLLDFVVFKKYDVLYIYNEKYIFKTNYFLAEMLLYTTMWYCPKIKFSEKNCAGWIFFIQNAWDQKCSDFGIFWILNHLYIYMISQCHEPSINMNLFHIHFIHVALKVILCDIFGSSFLTVSHDMRSSVQFFTCGVMSGAQKVLLLENYGFCIFRLEILNLYLIVLRKVYVIFQSLSKFTHGAKRQKRNESD